MSSIFARGAASGPLPLGLICWATAAIALNVGLARLVYGVMLPPIQRDLDLDYAISGTLNTVHLAGYLIGTLLAPAIGRRIGMSALARAGHLLVALGSIMCMAAPVEQTVGAALLGIGRTLTGLGASSAVLAVLVTLFAAIPDRSRAAVSAWIWAGMGIAVALAGVAADWILADGTAGWRAVFAVTALLGLLLMLHNHPEAAAAARSPVTSLVNAQRPFAARDLSQPRWRFLAGAYATFGVAYIAYATFAGARLSDSGTPHALVSLTWFVFGIAIIAGSALTVALNASWLAQSALSAVASAAAIGSVVAIGNSSLAAIAGAALVGLSLAAVPAIVTARARQRCSDQDFPGAFSLIIAALGAGQLVGPVAAGVLADAFGTIAIPAFAAAAFSITAVLAALDSAANRSQSAARTT